MSAVWLDVMMRSPLTGAARNLAIAIADASDHDGETQMKLARLREYAGGISQSTAQRAVKQMEAAGVLTIDRDSGGRSILIKLHDPFKMNGSKMNGSKMNGSKMNGSGEVVRIGKSRAESGLQYSDGAEAGANGQERGASAPLVPPPSFPPQTPPYYPPTLNPPDIPERVEGEDARRGNQFGVAQVTMFDEAAEIAGRAKASKSRPGKTEVMDFVLSIGLEPEDGEYIYENWEAGGWTRNGKPIKDWRACCRAWKAGRYFPSQKVSTGRGGVVRGYRKIDYSKGF